MEATLSKVIKNNDIVKTIMANIRLDDSCKNGHADWSFTGKITEKKKKNGKTDYEVAGAIGNKLIEYFPELEIFEWLHLRDVHGAPMCTIDNSWYFIKNRKWDYMKKSLMATDEEMKILMGADSKNHLAYLIRELGLEKKWEELSQMGIRKLEELSGEKWVNPYSKEEEKRNFKFTDSEYSEIKNLVEKGFYNENAIKERQKIRKREFETQSLLWLESMYRKEKESIKEMTDLIAELIYSGVYKEQMLIVRANKEILIYTEQEKGGMFISHEEYLKIEEHINDMELKIWKIEERRN